ncbi:AmiS/UreI family transporter [Rhodanobacter lindaniclasticus]
MLGVVLLFVGVVLIVNGLTLAGRIEAKEAAVLNLLVGSLSAFAGVLGAVQASTTADFLAVGTGLLFAFTYLYVAAVNWFGLRGAGLGWYCLFVAITALPVSWEAWQQDDPRMAAIWLIWSSLWLLFFIDGCTRVAVKRFLAPYAVLVGIVTCWIPGLLMLFGRW